MSIRTPTKRPMILAIRLFDRQVIDAGKPQPHQTIFVKFPILVAVRAKPVFGIVVPFVGEADGGAIFMERPALSYQQINKLLCPLSCQKLNNLYSALRKLGAISPARVDRVSKRDFLRVATVP